MLWTPKASFIPFRHAPETLKAADLVEDRSGLSQDRPDANEARVGGQPDFAIKGLQERDGNLLGTRAKEVRSGDGGEYCGQLAAGDSTSHQRE